MVANRSGDETRKNYLKSLREFKVSIIIGGLFIIMSSVISYFMGYSRNPEEIKLILGFPDWIMLGVLLPWVLIVLFTVFYSMALMKGDE